MARAALVDIKLTLATWCAQTSGSLLRETARGELRAVEGRLTRSPSASPEAFYEVINRRDGVAEQSKSALSKRLDTCCPES